MDGFNPQLYLITPPRIDDLDAFLRAFDSALEGGPVAALQIRLKAGEAIDIEMTRGVGQVLVPHAQKCGLAVFINDSAELAAELGADGVHLGQEDGSIKAARDLLGPDAIIGATCHDSRHLALEAGEAGADYVAFGAFYPTETKTPKSSATPDLLSWWQEMTELPCVAIGGITPENAAPLVTAGADFLAVSGAVWNAPDGPAAAVAAFAGVLEAGRA